MHRSLDEKFEVLLTNNPYTDRIFDDATLQKTSRKRSRQVTFNFKDAQKIYDRKVEGKETIQLL